MNRMTGNETHIFNMKRKKTVPFFCNLVDNFKKNTKG